MTYFTKDQINKMTREEIIKAHFTARLEDFIADSTTNEQGCWLYKGRTSRGYGSAIAPGGHSYYLHRASNHHFNGGDPSKMTLHKCNNSRCFNPEHLYSGTAADNARDRVESGIKLKRLTLEEVFFIKILILLGCSDDRIAEIYGVTGGAINHIRNGRRWGKVVLPEFLVRHFPQSA
jgi:hypothetical protein